MSLPATSIPSISPLPSTAGPRPFWSVMIPAYNPREDHLREALAGVLAQDPGPDRMQIEVVDDCSPNVDVAALVRSIAADRVVVSKTPKNLGLAGCWNTCIQRARGEWLHLLHQDDLVLPGLYGRLQSLVLTHPNLGAAFCRHYWSDSDGHLMGISGLEAKTPGELIGFEKKLAVWQRIQCASVVVRRTTYEAVGGYRHDIPYVLDWEMWCRINAAFPLGFEPVPGAVYRVHASSETSRLNRLGLTLQDMLDGGRIARSNYPRALQETTEIEFMRRFSDEAFRVTIQAFVANNFSDAALWMDKYRSEHWRARNVERWMRLRMRILLKSLRTGLSSWSAVSGHTSPS